MNERKHNRENAIHPDELAGDTIDIKGKSYVTYNGVLKKAHRMGLKSIETEMIMNPYENDKNVAMFRAVVIMDEGELGEEILKTFTGIGDAAPGNVSDFIKPHIVRMAETRAKGRALRDAVGEGVLAEELEGYSEQQQRRKPQIKKPAPQKPRELNHEEFDKQCKIVQKNPKSLDILWKKGEKGYGDKFTKDKRINEIFDKHIEIALKASAEKAQQTSAEEPQQNNLD